MAFNTQSMNKPAKVDGVPEGYEFVKDEEGRMAIRKIRDKKIVVEEVKEEVQTPKQKRK